MKHIFQSSATWLCKAALVPALGLCLSAHANPAGNLLVSSCASTNAQANRNATCRGSLGPASGGSTLTYFAAARSGSSRTDRSGNWGAAAGNVVVTNSTGWVLLSKNFNGSKSDTYGRLQNDGRFRITVSATDRYGRTYSFVNGNLNANPSRN